MFQNNLTLLRFMLRRDRWNILFWFIGIMSVVVGFGAGIEGMYPTAQERLTMAQTLSTPAMVAMTGPAFSLSDGSVSVGSLFAVLMFIWTAMTMGIMSIFTVVRHTRRDEEQGRIEVIRSLPVGKESNLSAALTLVFWQNLLFGLFMGLCLGAMGHQGMDMTGSLLFGLSMATAGMFFAGVAAVFCQLSSNPRTAQSLSLGLLIILYFIRAVGDMQNQIILSYVSILGLLQQAKVYVDNLWWPLLVTLLVTLVLVVVAFALCMIRDLGEGLFPARKGKADAAAYLRSPGGLAFRLLRTSMIVWAVVIFALAAAYGSVMGDIESFMKSNEMFSQMANGDPMVLISMFILIGAIAVAIPALQFVLKARSQEKRGFAEGVLVRAASRQAQLGGYFRIALLTCIVGPVISALGFYVSSTPVMKDPISLQRFLEASMLYIPALLFMLGLAMVLFAYIPKATGYVWAYLGYSLFIIYFGGLMNLPGWLVKLTPFGYIPKIPADTIDNRVILELALISLLAVIMFVVGFIGYRRRDMKFSN
ncbi:MAG: hypothetical protein FWE25_07465 [Lachnospiraceae bacterium]|nr:hypothetical protein [Lachnospiraceae bacterium]